MPAKRKQTKRPAEVIGNAVHVMRVLTGETDDVQPKATPEKNVAAVSLGSMGGKARAESLSDDKRKETARKAVAKRWKK